MDRAELILAILALLLTPGPTNTLMAMAGATQGWRGALRLLPAEIGAYLLVTLPLALFGTGLMAHFPLVKPLVTFAAGLWVMVLALRLWRLPDQPSQTAVTQASLFVTTLLNPKGLMIGLILLPGPSLAANTGLFVLLIAAVACLWAGLGACLARRDTCPAGQTPPVLRRVAGLWLAALSLGLIFNALPGLWPPA